MTVMMISGAEGRIETRYHQTQKAGAPVALVLHPHPEHGGTMNNKVTYALYWAFVHRGFNVMRFNFRGVGKSEGRFTQGEGELSDATSVLDWLQTYNSNASSFWVGGFSFGAWIGMQLLMRRPELNGFVSVSPPANLYDFNFLAPCPVSGLIIQGDQDTVVPKSSVDVLMAKLAQQKNIQVDYSVIRGADHFYTNCLEKLVTTVDAYIEASTGQGKLMKEGSSL